MADRESLSRTISEAVSRAVNEAINSSFPQRPTDTTRSRSEINSTATATATANVTSTGTQRPCNQATLATVTNAQQTDQRLPSAFGHLNGYRNVPPPKRRRSSACPKQKMHNKNIICLLCVSDISKPLAIPRGESRARLTEAGLTGKIAINSTWGGVLDVQREVSNLFSSSFGLSQGEMLPFIYLSTMPGGKKLCIPRTSQSFKWNATEVISTAAQGSLYIMATIPPLKDLEKESANSCDEDVVIENPSGSSSGNHDSHRPVSVEGPRQACMPVCAAEAATPSTSYSSYISLVNEDTSIIALSSDEEESAEHPTAHTRGDAFQLRDVLKEVQNNIDFDKRSYINVRRGHIWEDTCRYLSRNKFNPKAVISVKFADDDGSSEGAIDAGGPCREFLRLIIKAANEHSGIFRGNLDQRSLFPNASARAKNYYHLVGLIIGWSLLHGGPGGNFFSKTLFNSIAYGTTCKDVHMEDIPDSMVLENMVKVKSSNTLEELNDFLRDEYLQCVLEVQGHALQATNFEEKNKFISAICQHILIDSTRYLLDEVTDGLRVTGLLEAVRNHPRPFTEVLCRKETPLDAEMVDIMFEVHLAEKGTNVREHQERAVVFWRDYLQDCADHESSATLQDVLVFATGANEPPPMGFESALNVEFTIGKFPIANTCSLTLRLPLQHTEYNAFKEAMDFAILNSPCFGQP